MALLTNSSDAIAPNVTDILLTNKENGRIGLTAGIDLDIGAASVSIFTLNLTPTQFKEVLDKGAMVHIKLGTLVAEVVTGAVISKIEKQPAPAEEPDRNPIAGGETFGQGSNDVAPTLFPETVDNNPIASAEPEDVKPTPVKPAAKPAPKPTPAKK